MLECIIFVSGALIMVLEMVGARVMAPHLGTSAVVWTSLIGVVLACLACGAWIGGRLADRTLSRTTLSYILAWAGAGCALTALVHPFIGEATTASIPNIYIAAVVAAIGIFVLPATVFGMIAPYIIRLRLADIATAGATVGRLYALSTAGSIVGTFLGGFALVSWFASTQILLGVATGMIILSLMASIHKPLLRIALLLGFPATTFASYSYDAWLVALGTPPPIETPYNTIRITDSREHSGRPVRYISTSPGYMQSGMYLDNPTELFFEYTRYYGLGTVLFPHAAKILMLGGGGYSVPKWLLAGHGGLDGDRLTIDVVELDEGMTNIAQKYFALPTDPRLHIIHQDARRYINTNTKTYDLVLVDVFNSHYSVPFHMGTVEAAQAMRNAVAPQGALMMNIISAVEGDDAKLFQGIMGALETAFAEVYVFAVYKNLVPHALQNLMVLALPSPRPDLAPLLDGAPNTFSAPIQTMLHARIIPTKNHTTPPLRDEFAPVERYAQALLRK